ncbi:MAG TPA: MnmC family methyltransferase [Verrucomicrobiae bacterium]
MQTDSGYQLVRLNNGICSVRSLADHETFHPVVGPVAEAEALYVNQLQLRERIQKTSGEFVIWDVGLGAAANILTALRATREIKCDLRVVSFDHTPAPLEFALKHAGDLGYFGGYETHLEKLLRDQQVIFQDGEQRVDWKFHRGDFPGLIAQGVAKSFPKPHAILFDAFSPAKNPAMWTLPLFTNLFQMLDLLRPCAMPTYSRSTILRVTLLLAGFYVGAGHATGMKEETTIASNTLDLIAEPLGQRWLERAQRSHSAEPMMAPVYRTAPLSAASLEKLRAHPQF